MNKQGKERKEVQRIVRNKQRKERKVEPVEFSVKDEQARKGKKAGAKCDMSEKIKNKG